jgi:HEPN domain-containing protein
VKQLTQHWLNLAESDLDSALYLFEGARYPQSIYFICQAIEKILKATIIENSNTAPQKTHRLDTLATKTTLNFSDEQLILLTDLSKYYARVRYPDLSQVDFNTKTKTQPVIGKGKKVYQWIHKHYTTI